jgi:hypothetical protein
MPAFSNRQTKAIRLPPHSTSPQWLSYHPPASEHTYAPARDLTRGPSLATHFEPLRLKIKPGLHLSVMTVTPLHRLADCS